MLAIMVQWDTKVDDFIMHIGNSVLVLYQGLFKPFSFGLFIPSIQFYTISKKLSILYLKWLLAKISLHEAFFYLSKQCRP